MMQRSEFLNWIAYRLINVYHESENVDFVHRLREIAADAETVERELAQWRDLCTRQGMDLKNVLLTATH